MIRVKPDENRHSLGIRHRKATAQHCCEEYINRRGCTIGVGIVTSLVLPEQASTVWLQTTVDKAHTAEAVRNHMKIHAKNQPHTSPTVHPRF